MRRRDLVQPLKFEDSLRYGVGVRYQPIDALKLRAGMSLDNTPITNADYRTPRPLTPIVKSTVWVRAISLPKAWAWTWPTA